MSLALQNQMKSLEERYEARERVLEERVGALEALVTALKADLAAPSFPKLASIPEFPECLRALGLRPPSELEEIAALAREMSPSEDELDPPETNAQVEGADAPALRKGKKG